MVQPGGDYLGLYVQDIEEDWTVCDGCPAPQLIWHPFLERWISVLFFTNCAIYDVDYTEWYAPKIPSDGSLSVEIPDQFTMVGSGNALENTKDAVNKKFIGSGAPGFSALFIGLIDADESRAYRIKKDGKVVVARILRSSDLPPYLHTEGASDGPIIVYGASASFQPPSVLTDFLSKPSSAPFIIEGDPHGAELSWTCCPDKQGVSLEAYAD